MASKNEGSEERRKALAQAAELVIEWNIYHGYDIAREILALPEDAPEYEDAQVARKEEK